MHPLIPPGIYWALLSVRHSSMTQRDEYDPIWVHFLFRDPQFLISAQDGLPAPSLHFSTQPLSSGHCPLFPPAHCYLCNFVMLYSTQGHLSFYSTHLTPTHPSKPRSNLIFLMKSFPNHLTSGPFPLSYNPTVFKATIIFGDCYFTYTYGFIFMHV